MSPDAATIDKDTPPHQENTLATTNSHGSVHALDEKIMEAKGTTEPLQEKKARDLGTLSWICVVISLLFSMFLFSLDNVIVADIQPSIIKTLGNIDKLPWVSVGYALGATAVNLFVSEDHFNFAKRYQLTLL